MRNDLPPLHIHKAKRAVRRRGALTGIRSTVRPFRQVEASSQAVAKHVSLRALLIDQNFLYLHGAAIFDRGASGHVEKITTIASGMS